MLWIIPTPIGNLKDITFRALEALKEADLIVCEDTRVTSKLLSTYLISKPLLAFHEHSRSEKIKSILEQARSGNVAFVTDGGMPAISDPGFEIVRELIQNNIPFEVFPGPCALVNGLVASGLAVDSFTFSGFLSNKSASRKKELARLKDREETLVFYESPFRLHATLKDMVEILGDREAAVARELTKKFEEIRRGLLSELVLSFEKKPGKGEIVVVVSGANRKKLFQAGTGDYHE